MDFAGKKIGIWGFGIVGKAASQYLSFIGANIDVLDNRNLSQEELQTLQDMQASWSVAQDRTTIEKFLVRNEYIIVSPGIDTREYSHFSDKFIAEFDLFQAHYTKPIIAITGSVGKTTITHLLSLIIRSYNPNWWTGGNIGNSILDALIIQEQTEGAIIESSSFQLDQCKKFAPDFAIITNIYPNHLDRHGSLDEYINAKAKIYKNQHEDQIALMPLSLKDTLDLSQINSSVHFFNMTKPAPEILQQIPDTSILFFIEDEHIKAYNDGKYITLTTTSSLPSLSFLENWLIICAVLFLFQLPVDNLKEITAQSTLPEHRLEPVACINGINFYNDSKGTTTAATRAAVEKLKERPIILILGGIGKGVDRAAFIQELKHQVKAIVCFGKERDILASACKTNNIPYDVAEDMEQALNACMARAIPGDQIVLSPAGASFDQFKNYEERGNQFKEYVRKLQS